MSMPYKKNTHYEYDSYEHALSYTHALGHMIKMEIFLYSIRLPVVAVLSPLGQRVLRYNVQIWMQTQLIIAGSTGRGRVIPILSVAASLSEFNADMLQKIAVSVSGTLTLQK